MTRTTTRKAVNAHEISHVLRRRYKDFSHGNRSNPLSELLFIICSVKTSEANYKRSYLDFRRAFSTFAQLAQAKERVLAKSLHIGGLYRSKARLIRRAIRMIVARFGRPTLAPLGRMSDADCEKFLVSLPGVGIKVARCVMMYSLGRQVFPVDTHCWRICRRLGWIRPTRKGGLPSRHDMDRLQSKIPAHLRYSLHVNFVSFGRDICTAITPRCERCPLDSLCHRVGVRSIGRGGSAVGSV